MPGAPGSPDQPSVLAVAPVSTWAPTKACRLSAEASWIAPSRTRSGPPSCTSTPAATSILPWWLRPCPLAGGSSLRRKGITVSSTSTKPASGARPGATIEQPGRFVRSQSQLRLQLQGGDAVGVGGHQVRRPEPDGERQLRGVHHRAGGHRGLPAARGALPGERLGRELPALAVPARWAAEPVRPAHPRQIRGTRPLIREAALKLDERTGKVGHGGRSTKDVRYSFYATRPQPSPHFVWPEPEG